MNFSIVIPTFNVEQTINVTLDSIFSQSCQDFEVIILDNLSTDNTCAVIGQFTKYENLIYLSEKDSGIYDAMNKGISIARGNWIYFMGADDVFCDGKVLEKFENFFCDKDELIYGNVIWMPSNRKESGIWGYSKLLHTNINHQRIFYRKSLFKKYQSYDTNFIVAADHELNIRFFCDNNILKRYYDIDITYYNETGFSAHKIDEHFWNSWKSVVYLPFKSHLSKKEIFLSYGWYCWHNIKQKKYLKATSIFCAVFFWTQDLAFVKHTLSQAVKALRAK